jgi:hypothetical protein
MRLRYNKEHDENMRLVANAHVQDQNTGHAQAAWQAIFDSAVALHKSTQQCTLHADSIPSIVEFAKQSPGTDMVCQCETLVCNLVAMARLFMPQGRSKLQPIHGNSEAYHLRTIASTRSYMVISLVSIVQRFEEFLLPVACPDHSPGLEFHCAEAELLRLKSEFALEFYLEVRERLLALRKRLLALETKLSALRSHARPLHTDIDAKWNELAQLIEEVAQFSDTVHRQIKQVAEKTPLHEKNLGIKDQVVAEFQHAASTVASSGQFATDGDEKAARYVTFYDLLRSDSQLLRFVDYLRWVANYVEKSDKFTDLKPIHRLRDLKLLSSPSSPSMPGCVSEPDPLQMQCNLFNADNKLCRLLRHVGSCDEVMRLLALADDAQRDFLSCDGVVAMALQLQIPGAVGDQRLFKPQQFLEHRQFGMPVHIGTWNIQSSKYISKYNPQRLKGKLLMAAEMAILNKWSIIALQELPNEPDVYNSIGDSKEESHSVQEQDFRSILAAFQARASERSEDREADASIIQLMQDLCIQGVRHQSAEQTFAQCCQELGNAGFGKHWRIVGNESDTTEATGFLYDSSQWEMTKRIDIVPRDTTSASNKKMFAHTPCCVLFKSKAESTSGLPVVVLALAAVHLKAKGVQDKTGHGLAKTQAEAEQLHQLVAPALKTELDECLKAYGECKALGFVGIMGDFNLAATGGDASTDPGKAWDGFASPQVSMHHLLPDQHVPTNAMEFNINHDAHTYDGCLVGASVSGRRHLPLIDVSQAFVSPWPKHFQAQISSFEAMLDHDHLPVLKAMRDKQPTVPKFMRSEFYDYLKSKASDHRALDLCLSVCCVLDSSISAPADNIDAEEHKKY